MTASAQEIPGEPFVGGASSLSLAEMGALNFGHLPACRADAVVAGDIFYYSGKPCKKGHFAPRYVSNRLCSACIKLIMVERRRVIGAEASVPNSVVESERLRAAEDRLSSWCADNTDGLDMAIASRILASGGWSVIPGVFCVDMGWQSSPVFDLAVSLAKAKSLILHDPTQGLFFAPRITANAPPKTTSAARQWHAALSGLKQSVLSNSIRVYVTSVLQPARGVRGRDVLAAWVAANTDVANEPCSIVEVAK